MLCDRRHRLHHLSDAQASTAELATSPGAWIRQLRSSSMHFNHIHVRVSDLPAAVAWMRDVWKVEPDFENDRMASLPLGSFWLFFDSADEDSTATVGFETDNCDRDFTALARRGAKGLEAPADSPWGARTAYIQGPGRLRFELEQALTKSVT